MNNETELTECNRCFRKGNERFNCDLLDCDFKDNSEQEIDYEQNSQPIKDEN